MSAKEPAAGYGPEECYDLFASLFPEGFAGKDVLTEIAPEGWLDSPLRFAFHPTREQVHRERVRIHHNLRTWPLRSGNRPEVPEPTMEETRARYKDGPVDIGREVGELVAGCLWELFSHENDVLGREGRVVHIGSWRGAAGFLADQLNRHSGERRYDYLDFYMGHHWIAQRVDLTPVYAMVFRRLKRHGLNWSYRYPQLHIFAPPAAHRDKRSRRELDKLKALLRRANREALNALKHEPAPAVVLAYRSVYETFPRGWPPWERVPAEPQGC